MRDVFQKITADGEVLGISPLYARSQHIIVGFSGGADSSLLLSYFVHLRDLRDDFPKIHAVHVNHMLRGAHSDGDEEFCRKRCSELDVPLTVKRIDIPSLMAESGSGTEECARNARYSVFRHLSESLEGEALIATAHNADDNLETVLFNLVRGGGAAGLSGIPPVRDGVIIRPLLGLGSAEIRSACDNGGIPYVTDGTNTDETYTRNFIRHSVVPLLKQVNPSAAAAVLRGGIALREDDRFIRDLAQTAVGEYLPNEQTDSAEIPRDVLARLDGPVLARAVAMLVAAVTDIAMSGEQVRLCRKMVLQTGTGKVSLPDSVTFEVSKKLVTAYRSMRTVEDFSFEVDLPSAGECVKCSCPEAGFDMFFCRSQSGLPVTDENIYKLSINTAVRFDTIYGKVYIRSRLPGDTLFLGGHTRRLKKMICDRGIPESLRQRLPVICDDEGVLLVPGLPVRGPAYARQSDISDGNVLYVLYCLHRRF